MKHIAILDFGSQYTHLIARNIRDFKVLAKIYPADSREIDLESDEILGIILSGGPQSVYKKESLKIDPGILALNKPILGLCYGHQLLAQSLNGQVKKGKVREYGPATLNIKLKSFLFKSVKRKTKVWMSHGDSVAKLPPGFKSIASTEHCPVAAMENPKKRIYGLQFHPEVQHTEEGGKILENFVFSICRAEKNWNIKNIISSIIKNVKKQVKNKKVFVLVSGGVDSSVAFALLTKALGKKRVLGLYIDSGFMRKNESQEIIKSFAQAGFTNFTTIDYGESFFAKLKNIYDPEIKRLIIGQTFLEAKKAAAYKVGLKDSNWLLGQGTIYPDTIESGGTKHADKIKTHHNRIDEIQKMVEKGLVVEPLKDFYKDEVREIGKLLKLPPKLIKRHPFPGPGLAIRCLCFEKDKNNVKLTRERKKVTQFMKIKFSKVDYELLSVKSVGVQGDNRTYAHPLAVWGEKNWKKLDHIATLTANSLREANRVILLLNPKKENKFLLPANSLFLMRERIGLLREIDDIVTRIIKKHKIYDDIWQFPVVLVPILNEEGKESIVLRPFWSRDAMTTNFYQMKKNVLDEIIAKIKSTNKISHIFYDVTNKPPGTIEWE